MRASRCRPPQGPARALRPARLLQGPRPLRWARALLHLRRGRPQPGDRRVVQRRRHRDPRGLRHDRELRRRHGQPPRRQPHRHRRSGTSRAAEVKIGDGDEVLLARPARHGRLPQPPRGDGQDARPPTGGCTPATRALSTPTATSRSRAASRSSSRPPAASTSPRRRSSRSSRPMCPYASQFMVFGDERNYCVALVTLDPDAMAGWAEENGMERQVLHRDRAVRRGAEDGRRLRRRAQQPSSTGGRPSRSGSSSTTT